MACRNSHSALPRLAAAALLAVVPGMGCAKKPVTLVEKAAVAMEKGQYRDVLLLCDQQLGLDKDDTDALLMRGRALAMLNRYEEAVADFSRVIALRPDDYEPLYRREHAYKKLGKTELAMKDQERAKALDPSYQSAYPYEPGTFIRRSVPPPAPKTTLADDAEPRNEKKKKKSLGSDDATEEGTLASRDKQREKGTLGSQDASQPSESELSQERSPKSVPSEDSEGVSSNASPGARRGLPDRTERRSVATDAPGPRLRSPRTGPLDAPGGELEMEDSKKEEEKPSFQLPVRPSISTALPIPRGDVELPKPYDFAPALPTTGLPVPQASRPTSPYLPNRPQGPLTTGLPVFRPGSGIGSDGTVGTQGPLTTGLQRPTTTGAAGIKSLIPGQSTNSFLRYLRGADPSTSQPPNATRSTSLPGTAIPSPSGVISTAVPGRTLPTPPKKVSSALPESASPPR